MKKMLTTALTLSVVLVGNAFADSDYLDKIYLGGGVGASFQSKDGYNQKHSGLNDWYFDDAAEYALRVGVQKSWLKSELELSHTSYDAEKNRTVSSGATANATGGSLDRTSLMINFLGDYQVSSFSLFAGGGVGASNVHWKDVKLAGMTGSLDNSDTIFSYNLIAGANYNINENWAIGTRYKYIDGMDYKIEDNNSLTEKFDFPASHNISLNLEYSF